MPCRYINRIKMPFAVYIHTGEAEVYRPITEIVAELDALELEAKKTDAALKKILTKIIG